MTKVTLSMPVEAAKRLQAKVDSNAPDLKEFMKSLGILSIVVVEPKPKQDKPADK